MLRIPLAHVGTPHMVQMWLQPFPEPNPTSKPTLSTPLVPGVN